MTQRLRSVARTLQTFEQSDLKSLLFGFSTDCCEQPLQFSAMGQVAHPVVKAKHKFAILCEFVRVWIFVNAVYGGNRELLELPRDSFVRSQHEFFDQLVRFVVLDAL